MRVLCGGLLLFEVTCGLLLLLNKKAREAGIAVVMPILYRRRS